MKRIIYLAAIGVIGSMGITGCSRNDESNATPAASNHPVENAANNAATRTSDLAQEAKGKAEQMSESVMTDDAAIRESLASIVDDAMGKNSLPSLMQFFTDAGRTQIGDDGKKDYPDLDALVDTLQSDWKTKYGHDFKLTTSKIKDDHSFNISSVDTVNTPEGKSKNQHTVTVTLSADTHAPNMAIPMLRDGTLGSWRIDVPTTMTAMSLHDNLLSALTAIKSSEANWPSDEAAAYRDVTRRVLAAIIGKPM